MEYLLNLEQMEGRWIAHVARLPGCFVTAETREAAIAAAPQAIHAYAAWCRDRGAEAPPGRPVEVRVDEVHRSWISRPDYEVNAFFASDRPPLVDEEMPGVLRLLEHVRVDLLVAVAGLSESELAHAAPGKWPIVGILNHVARAENWYLSRLGLEVGGLDDLPSVLARLAQVRQQLVAVLPGLTGDERVVSLDGELWSPRKIVRRALWHERDHTDHIRQVRHAQGFVEGAPN